MSHYQSVYSEYNFRERLNKLIDFDLIRIQKLLEICQYMVLYMILGFIGGTTVERVFPSEDKVTVKKASSLQLGVKIAYRIMILGIFGFYAVKIADLVPFMFHFTSKYRPGMKGESYHAKSIVFTYIMYKTQPSLGLMIDELTDRIV